MLKPLDTLYHVVFTVPNFDRSLAFYRDMLGFRVIWEKRNFRLSPATNELINCGRLKRDDGMVTGQVELVEFIESNSRPVTPRHPRDMGFWGVVFEVADMDKICREWKAKGVVFERETETQQLVGGRFVHSALIKDIDGNRIELVQEGQKSA